MDERPEDNDTYLWLEEVASEEARAWVTARNAETVAALCDAQFERDRTAVLDILNAADRIPFVQQRGPDLYNFWQDAANPKGLWRRTSLESYRTDEPVWEVLIDLDALVRAEGEDWVWRGTVPLPPDSRRVLVQLSRGGADALVIREFDVADKAFIAGGFELPEAKGSAQWLDADTLLVSSALGGADFQTTCGYARTVRRWRRGTPFESAEVIFTCAPEHMIVYGWREHAVRFSRTFIERYLDFEHHELYVVETGAAQKLDLPTDAHRTVKRDWLALNLRTDWSVDGRTYPAGALIVIALSDFLAGSRDFAVLFAPSPTCFLQDHEASGDVIAFSVLDNVRSRLFLARHAAGGWTVEPLGGFSDMATLSIAPLSPDDKDVAALPETFIVNSQDSLTPPTLSLARFGEPPDLLKQAPARFDSRGLAITQHEAVSVDGVRIPYFQVARKDLRLDGGNATLLTGYGGYQVSSLPYYGAGSGRLWLERGGVFVIANIRGGGEFGPDWHKAGMREGKRLAHDDFAAVAKDLIARGVTNPGRLACMGGSNGGLLVGNMLTRYPDLFGAIVCTVPLLDMRRYTKLTAGSSWISEYGDPDRPEDWAFLRAMSAYHAVAAGRPYPPILLTTSARDDRVHPSHARKMAAKLAALGYRTYFHEPTGGGHGGGADNAQLAYNSALVYAFLRHTIAPDMTEATSAPAA